jgi:hypothetical protein
MITVVCPTPKVAQEVRDLFNRYGVDLTRVHELGPQLNDSTIYLVINYTHDKEAQISDEVHQKIPGARVQ